MRMSIEDSYGMAEYLVCRPSAGASSYRRGKIAHRQLLLMLAFRIIHPNPMFSGLNHFRSAQIRCKPSDQYQLLEDVNVMYVYPPNLTVSMRLLTWPIVKERDAPIRSSD